MNLAFLIQYLMPFPHDFQLKMALDRRMENPFRNCLPPHIFIDYKEINQATHFASIFLIIYKAAN